MWTEFKKFLQTKKRFLKNFCQFRSKNFHLLNQVFSKVKIISNNFVGSYLLSKRKNRFLSLCFQERNHFYFYFQFSLIPHHYCYFWWYYNVGRDGPQKLLSKVILKCVLVGAFTLFAFRSQKNYTTLDISQGLTSFRVFSVGLLLAESVFITNTASGEKIPQMPFLGVQQIETTVTSQDLTLHHRQ